MLIYIFKYTSSLVLSLASITSLISAASLGQYFFLLYYLILTGVPADRRICVSERKAIC